MNFIRLIGCTARPPDGRADRHAARRRGAAGAPPGSITIVGTSKGAAITALVSYLVRIEQDAPFNIANLPQYIPVPVDLDLVKANVPHFGSDHWATWPA